MPTPEQIFLVYQGLAEHAATIKEFQIAKGERVSGTVKLILGGDREKLPHVRRTRIWPAWKKFIRITVVISWLVKWTHRKRWTWP
mgnify:CR=1 FL=1